MKPLIYAVVAATVVGFSAGAYACGAHTASAQSSSIVVAQQQAPGTATTSSSESQSSQSK